MEWSVVDSTSPTAPVIGGPYSEQTWITFSEDGRYTIEAAVWGAEGTEPLATRQVVVCVGDFEPVETPTSPSISDSGVQITVEPQNTTYDLGRKTPLSLTANPSKALSTGETIRWHLAGYRLESIEETDPDISIDKVAVIHNYESLSPSAEFSMAGVYTVAAEIIKTENGVESLVVCQV